MVPGGFSTLVSQVTEPSSLLTQLVGTTVLPLPVLLPGPFVQVCDCAIRCWGAKTWSPTKTAEEIFNTEPIDMVRSRLTTLCMGFSSADGIVADFLKEKVELSEWIMLLVGCRSVLGLEAPWRLAPFRINRTKTGSQFWQPPLAMVPLEHLQKSRHSR